MFEEFVASFEDTGTEGKAFVRGSTFNPEKREKAASEWCTVSVHNLLVMHVQVEG